MSETRHNIVPWGKWNAASPSAGARTLSTTTFDLGHLYCTAGQNQWTEYRKLMAAGTWSLELTHVTGNNRAIYTVSFNGVDKGTIDGYSASTVGGVRTTITGLTQPATAVVDIRFTAATKNGASSGYAMSLGHINLWRTGS